MSARPIDMKITLPQAQQLSRLQQQQNDMHKNNLHNHVVNTNDQVEKRLKKVINSEKTNRKRINKEKSNKESTQEDQQQKQKNTEDNNNKNRKNQNSILGSNIDIKI